MVREMDVKCKLFLHNGLSAFGEHFVAALTARIWRLLPLQNLKLLALSGNRDEMTDRQNGRCLLLMYL